jgi:hypothetical protein
MTTSPPRHARLTAARALVADNPLLVLIAGLGFAVSFQTIARLARAQHMPGWPVLYPILIDVGFLAAIVEARKAIDDDRSDLAPRALAWLLAALTVYVNAHGSPAGDYLGLTMHVAAPALWIAFLELTRWRKVRKARTAKADRIPLARWAFTPWRTLGMRKRMVLHNVTSYGVAVAREEALFLARDLVRAELGKRWRKTAPALLRHHLATGTLPEAVSSLASSAQYGTMPNMAGAVSDWVTGALTGAARMAARVRAERHAIEHATGAPATAPKVARQPRQGDRAKKHAEARRLRAAHPEMTLRQIGDKTGLSERTVSRVTGARPVSLRAAGG